MTDHTPSPATDGLREAIEALRRLNEIGNTRRDQISDEDWDWFCNHPLRLAHDHPVGWSGALGPVADYLATFAHPPLADPAPEAAAYTECMACGAADHGMEDCPTAPNPTVAPDDLPVATGVTTEDEESEPCLAPPGNLCTDTGCWDADRCLLPAPPSETATTDVEDDDGPECETCGKTTCPDADLESFSAPVDCEYAPIYEALHAAKDCDYGCARDLTNQGIRLHVVPVVEQIAAARFQPEPGPCWHDSGVTWPGGQHPRCELRAGHAGAHEWDRGAAGGTAVWTDTNEEGQP